MNRKPSSTSSSVHGRSRPKRLVAGLFTAVLMTIGLVAVAPAASADTIVCYDIARGATTTNVLGQVTHGVTNEVLWCVNRTRGTLSSVQTRATHRESYLWNWVGWNGNFKQGGVGYTSFTYYVQGSFKECAAYCFNSASNWLKITVYANGTYYASGH